MKQLPLILAMLVLLFSCGGREEIIPPDSLTNILSDLYLTEAMLTSSYNSYDSLTKYRRIYMDALFAKHGVSRARFDSSYHYYENHLDILEEIHSDVVTELTRRQPQE